MSATAAPAARPTRFAFRCANCGETVAYRDTKRGYVHTSGRNCGGSTVAARVESVAVVR